SLDPSLEVGREALDRRARLQPQPLQRVLTGPIDALAVLARAWRQVPRAVDAARGERAVLWLGSVVWHPHAARVIVFSHLALLRARPRTITRNPWPTRTDPRRPTALTWWSPSRHA